MEDPKSVGERLRSAIGQSKSIRAFQVEIDRDLKKRGERGVTYPTINAYLKGASEPPLTFLHAAAALLKVLPAWLVLGEGQRTAAEADSVFERAQGERLKGEAREDSQLVKAALKEIGVDQLASGALHSALRRFALKLRDVETLDSPWVDRRGETLAAAARFAVGVDVAFGHADSPPERPDPDSRLSTAGLLLFRSSSVGWKAEWYDAVLKLFSSRVIGLGERQLDNWLDLHAPTMDDRRRSYGRPIKPGSQEMIAVTDPAELAKRRAAHSKRAKAKKQRGKRLMRSAPPA